MHHQSHDPRLLSSDPERTILLTHPIYCCSRCCPKSLLCHSRMPTWSPELIIDEFQSSTHMLVLHAQELLRGYSILWSRIGSIHPYPPHQFCSPPKPAFFYPIGQS